MSRSATVDNLASPSVRKLAAIVAGANDQSDEIIDRLIIDIQQEGRRIAGLRQRILPGADTGCAVRLEDILTGDLHRITQDLGRGSTSCNIDTAAVEHLALQQSTALDEDVDLAFVNRFGKRESQGAGFCCVIERAIELEIPVLTIVRETSLQAWLDYGGDWVTTLPVDENSIRRWSDTVLAIPAW